MDKDNLQLIEEYYNAMGRKDFKAMEQFLSPDVVCIGPPGQARGIGEVLAGVQRLAKYYNKLTLRAKFASNQQVMVAYDLDFPLPIGHVPYAGLFTFKEGKIIHLELFFDVRPYESKLAELFPQAIARK